MSAFQVSEFHIDVLVSARLGLDSWRFGDITDTALGQLLVLENLRSLAARYEKASEDAMREEAKLYEHKPVFPGCSPVKLLKAIHCYIYQSCEHEGWETSDACAYVHALEQVLIQKLPGYAEAPWGLEGERGSARRIA